tara:strand:- start:564 stop:728 length:165 start_codon:yes stop_codon:yes gene_type:complete
MHNHTICIEIENTEKIYKLNRKQALKKLLKDKNSLYSKFIKTGESAKTKNGVKD